MGKYCHQKDTSSGQECPSGSHLRTISKSSTNNPTRVQPQDPAPSPSALEELQLLLKLRMEEERLKQELEMTCRNMVSSNRWEEMELNILMAEMKIQVQEQVVAEKNE